jgi:hypothetical protein
VMQGYALLRDTDVEHALGTEQNCQWNSFVVTSPRCYGGAYEWSYIYDELRREGKELPGAAMDWLAFPPGILSTASSISLYGTRDSSRHRRT